MGYIKRLYIKGLKKFKEMDVIFNENINILIGDNESGKSTILEAINIVLNQKYKTTDKSILNDLFNVDIVKAFKNNPSVATLPSIFIQIEFKSSYNHPELYFGENNKENKEEYGIAFECKYVDDPEYNITEKINAGVIPLEYYTLTWTTFQGSTYNMLKKPLETVFIDTSEESNISSFNYYNKTIFNRTIDEKDKMKIKDDFRQGMRNVFEGLSVDKIDDTKSFAINDKKVILESILSIKDGDIPIENKGSGMENLIKTEIALTKSQKSFDSIMIEEPENHLSFTNLRKMIKNIQKQQVNSQIILTTHNDYIASSLDLKNIIWIQNNQTVSLKDIDEKDSQFFIKAPNNNLLLFLLSSKIVLVEGPTEYLLFPMFFTKQTGKTLEESGIAILSCNGIQYKRYLNISKQLDKKIAVITDNDEKDDRIQKSKTFNNENENIHIFMSDDINEFTWEVCLFNKNEDVLIENIEIDPNAKYEYVSHPKLDVHLRKMLNNKADTAYDILTNDSLQLDPPDYVQEAIKWLND